MKLEVVSKNKEFIHKIRNFVDKEFQKEDNVTGRYRIGDSETNKELEIINALKTLAVEMESQDDRSTYKPFWVDSKNNPEVFSFFESDVDSNERNFVKGNSRARKMNVLRELLIELGRFI